MKIKASEMLTLAVSMAVAGLVENALTMPSTPLESKEQRSRRLKRERDARYRQNKRKLVLA